MKKTVVITGGVRGIGRAISERFLKLGYEVIAVYNASNKLAQEFAKDNKNLHLVKADIGDEKQLKGLFEFISSKFDHLDVLVNNAGIDIPET